MLPISEDYAGSVCELRTTDNGLVATGFIEKVTEEYVQVTTRRDTMPVICYGLQVKINIFNSTLGFRSLMGVIFTSGPDFARIVDVATLTDYERRNFFRVDTNVRAAIFLDGEDEPVSVDIDNLSLSGVLFACHRQLDPQRLFRLKLKLRHRVCTFPCKIRRVIAPAPGSRRPPKYGCEFLEDGGQNMDTLCAFIFEKQREQLSRQNGI